MKRLYFVRHGQSIANAGGVTMEHALIPLTSLGIAQASRVAEALPPEPSRIWVSQYERARATAQPYCRRVGREAEVHPLLHEFSALDPANLKGMSGDERRPIANAYWEAADPAVRTGPQAETFFEFDARVTAFMAELPAYLDNSVLFGHGIWFVLLWWKLRGFTVEDSFSMKAFRRAQRDLPMPNCAVYILEETPEGGWHLNAHHRAMLEVAAV